MTKGEAIYSFFAGFDMDAYPNDVVPDADSITFPYIMYDASVGNAGDDPISITASIWFNTTSELVPNAKVEEISNAIGLGGKLVAYDGGAVWIRRGQPWCNSLTDETNDAIKRRILNIELEFM